MAYWFKTVAGVLALTAGSISWVEAADYENLSNDELVQMRSQAREMNKTGGQGDGAGKMNRYGQGNSNGSGSMNRYGQGENQRYGSGYSSRQGGGNGGGRRNR